MEGKGKEMEKGSEGRRVEGRGGDGRKEKGEEGGRGGKEREEKGKGRPPGFAPLGKTPVKNLPCRLILCLKMGPLCLRL